MDGEQLCFSLAVYKEKYYADHDRNEALVSFLLSFFAFFVMLELASEASKLAILTDFRAISRFVDQLN